MSKKQDQSRTFSRKIDDFISVISPAWALSRAAKRNAYEQLRGYDAANHDPNDPYWLPRSSDADSVVLPKLDRLRAKSRDVLRNNEWAISIESAIVSGVLGHKGIRLQVKGDNQERANQEREYLVERLNRLDITEKYKFQGLLKQSIYQWINDGEVFIRLTHDRRANELRAQIYDPEQIWSSGTYRGNNEIRAGIEIDSRTGKHLAYYINSHPGGYGTNTKTEEIRVPSQDMIHFFIRKRANQTRGVPLLSPIIKTLRGIGEYNESEIVANRVASCLAVLIKKPIGHTPPNQNSDGDNIQSLHPGMVARIGAGEDVSIVKPERPVANFPGFMGFQIRAACAPVGLSYETVSKDLNNVTYGSMRGGQLNEREGYRMIQGDIIDYICSRFLYEINLLRLLKSDMPAYGRYTWVPRGYDWIDPSKDIAAKVLEVNNNLESKENIIAQKGNEIEEIFAQREKERADEVKMGIQTEADVTATSTGKAKITT